MLAGSNEWRERTSGSALCEYLEPFDEFTTAVIFAREYHPGVSEWLGNC
jgi:hypothetical protein